MRSNNPVLSRPDAFTPANQSQQEFRADYTWNPQQSGGYGPQAPQDAFNPYQGPQAAQPQAQTGRMSIEDVITKTAMLLLVLVATAGATWFLLPIELIMPAAIVGSLIAFVTVMFVSMRRNLPVAGVFAYAAIEGVVIGGWSKLFEFMYPGIVMQAVIGTLVAAFVVLGAYQFLGVRVQGRLAKIVIVSIIAYAIISLVNLLLIFAGINIGWASIGASAGPLSWLSAGIGVVLAAASLLMDFESIENGVRMGAPEKESWRGAFGLIVTLIWLYTLLLRILSFFRND